MAFAPTGPRYRAIPGSWVAGGARSRATLTTSLDGDNNDVVFTASERGTGGNSLRVAYAVSGTSTAFRVDYDRSTSTLTVTSATDAEGRATSTAADVVDGVNGGSFPVTASLASDNDGTGVIAALAATALRGGSEFVIGTGSSRTPVVRR